MVGWLGQSRFCGFSDVQTQLWFALFIINSAKNIKLYKYKFNVSSGKRITSASLVINLNVSYAKGFL